MTRHISLITILVLIISSCRQKDTTSQVFLDISLGLPLSSVDSIVKQNYTNKKLSLSNKNSYYYTFTGLKGNKELYGRLHVFTTGENVSTLLLKISPKVAYIDGDAEKIDLACYPLDSSDIDAIVELYTSKYGETKQNKPTGFDRPNNDNEIHYLWTFPDKNYQILIAVADDRMTTGKKCCMIYYELMDKPSKKTSKQDI